MTNNIATKYKANKNKKMVHPQQKTGITVKKSLKITIFFFAALLIFGLIYIFILKSRNKTVVSGFGWCKSGKILKLEDATLKAISIENYQSSQYEDKVCHLKYTMDNISSDLYLDEKALINFNSKEEDKGNGCVVYNVEDTQKTNELCFGSKVKDIVKVIPSIPSSTNTQTTPTYNFTGTNWRYRIDVGGGVEGVMSFEKDENGSLAGSFTEFGPEGMKEKKFVGSFEKENFLLTLEEFPTFKVELSVDGKTITGKPVEESKDIYYPDDFFKATLEE